MKKYLSLIAISLLMHTLTFAQKQIINGKVVNKETGEAVPSVTISSKDGKSIVNANEKGSFSISVPSLPVTLIFSSAGMETKEINVSGNESVTIELLPDIKIEDPVVVGADRKPVRLLQTATSLEAVSLANIKVAPGSYYDLLARKKGVDETTSSMTFKTISTRGFNGSGSTRVNQLVDGMDNQAPGLNFFLGNFLGLTELDVESMEILPGASSALYGPGGINGTILINSKNPFKHQGLSILLKEGINHVGASNRDKSAPYHDFSIRYAKAFNNKFAFKIGAQYLSATDWLASDTSNYIGAGAFGRVGPGTRQSDPNYNGVNVYGDETSIDVYPFLLAAGVPNPQHMYISRTGYHEKDVIDPETKNIKLSGSLNYKLTNSIEAILMGYWATGNSVYTGNNRYALKGVKLGQYKLELKHPDWFIRSYTTQENAGEAYTATVAMQMFNEVWKPSSVWYTQYLNEYFTALATGASNDEAFRRARVVADMGRPEPGSDQFNQIFNQVRKTPIPQGGLFLEKSQLWMTEGQYNFRKVKFAEIIVGGNYKKYILDSDGTLFIDTPEEPIGINELGVYAQISKRFLNEMLTLSVSGRLDKNEDFKEQFTPRVTGLFKVAKDNYIRASFQTAYRFPSTQQKYIRLNVGSYEILGGLPWVMDTMQADKDPVYEMIDGVPSSLPYVYREFKPENMTSYEIGYRGLLAEKLMVDAYGYWGRYENFLGRNILFQPATGKVFSTVVNSPTKVKTYGFGLGLDYKLPNNFSAFVNGYSDVLTDVPTGFQAFFNAPEYRFNAGIANSGFGKKKQFGFNVNFRWQDDIMWDGELANGPVKSFSTMDAQVSYNIKKIKSTFRLGGTNIFNKYYKNAYGNPEIGGLYYVAYAFNL